MPVAVAVGVMEGSATPVPFTHVSHVLLVPSVLFTQYPDTGVGKDRLQGSGEGDGNVVALVALVGSKLVPLIVVFVSGSVTLAVTLRPGTPVTLDVTLSPGAVPFAVIFKPVTLAVKLPKMLLSHGTHVELSSNVPLTRVVVLNQ